MGSVTVSLIAFAFIFGGALLGMLLRHILPEPHLEPESKDVVKLGMGLVGTMAALVLGLLVASAKGSYDAQSTELTEMSAKIVLLDRALAHYGPETQESRDLLRSGVVRNIDQLWPQEGSQKFQLDPTASSSEAFFDKIQGLSPKDDRQRLLQSQAITLAIDLGQTRWLMFAQAATSVSKPLVIVMVFWLTSSPTSIAVHPSGKFAYVTNSGSNNVSTYTVESMTGALTSKGAVPSGSSPTSIAIHPSGKFAYVTNAVSNDVSMYSIDDATGALTLIGTIGT